MYEESQQERLLKQQQEQQAAIDAIKVIAYYSFSTIMHELESQISLPFQTSLCSRNVTESINPYARAYSCFFRLTFFGEWQRAEANELMRLRTTSVEEGGLQFFAKPIKVQKRSVAPFMSWSNGTANICMYSIFPF